MDGARAGSPERSCRATCKTLLRPAIWHRQLPEHGRPSAVPTSRFPQRKPRSVTTVPAYRDRDARRLYMRQPRRMAEKAAAVIQGKPARSKPMGSLRRSPEIGWSNRRAVATYVKVRQTGRIVSVAVTVAVAVNDQGRREVLGMAIGASPITWQPERPGPTRREPRRAQRSYTTCRDTIRFPQRKPRSVTTVPAYRDRDARRLHAAVPRPEKSRARGGGKAVIANNTFPRRSGHRPGGVGEGDAGGSARASSCRSADGAPCLR